MACCKKKPMDEKPEAIVPFPDGGWGWLVCLATFSTQFIVLGTMNNFGVMYVELLNEFNTGKAEAGNVTPIFFSLSSCAEQIVYFLLSMGWFHYLWHDVPTWASSNHPVSKVGLPRDNNDWLYGGCRWLSVRFDIYQYLPDGLDLWINVWSRSKHVLFSICSHLGTVLFKAPLISQWNHILRQRRRYFVHGTFSQVRLATEEGIDPFKATLLIGIMSVGSTLGRLLFGKMADHPKVNRLYLYQISFLMIGISNTLCPVLTSYPGLVTYATVFGFFEGCYVLLAPVLTGDIVGRDKMAHGVGILFALKSVPLTLGPPIAGFIYDASNSYQVAFYIAGAVPTAAACMMFGIPFLMPEREENKKCRVVLADESGYNEKPTYFDEKRALAEKEQQMYRDRYTGIPEVIIEEPETDDNFRPVSFYSVASNDNALFTLSINNKRNTIGLSSNSISTVRETCLVSVDTINVRRSRLLQLRGELSSSVFSLVRRYMDMPKEIAASECGSIACIPQHIANNPQQPPPSQPEKVVVVGLETVV